jgi:RNA-directed DNA polymerase
MNTRWNISNMLKLAEKLFAKIKKRKRLAQDSHDIHFLAREIDEWLPKKLESLIDGSYSPEYLKRWEFQDATVDSLTIPDRILQHVLLQELKPTFQYVLNPNCVHIHGPYGVKLASDRVAQALEQDQPLYMIRADIKGYYSSIPHYTLIQDIKKSFDDPKVQAMLEAVIRNGLETNKGYRNPDKGIALRGPLSQLFSAIYLKPLDDALSALEGTYIRFQDDFIFLCKTKRQFLRAKRKMMEILHERKLSLSRKKSRLGRVDKGFHFLGIQYPGTRTQDHTDVVVIEEPATLQEFLLNNEGGEPLTDNQSVETIQSLPNRSIPHARTLRHARERIKLMIADGFSTRQCRLYLQQWARWWVCIVPTWQLLELLERFKNQCFDEGLKIFSSALIQHLVKKHLADVPVRDQTRV